MTLPPTPLVVGGRLQASQLRVICSSEPASRGRRGPQPPSAAQTERRLLPSSLSSLLGSTSRLSAPGIDQERFGVQRLHPATLPLAVGGLSAVAADVFLPGSLHLLQPLDTAAHVWVVSHLDSETQHVIAGKFISDAAIVLGLTGWAGVTAAALHTKDLRLGQALGTSAFIYWLAGGSVRHGDPPLVDFLKHAFHRARPSDVHHTFSFPSGHTTAATFVCGALFVLLLPLALQALERQAQGEGQEQRRSSVRQMASWLEQRQWQLWAVVALTTAAGRVLADAHWCSDTMAGACLGAALTAATVELCRGLASLSQAAGSGRRA